MQRSFKWIRNFLAVLFFLLAVAGGLLPVIQGWIFFLAGYLLLDIRKKHQIEQALLNRLKKNRFGARVHRFWVAKKERHADTIRNAESKIQEQTIESLGTTIRQVAVNEKNNESR
jgi:hypothetical protein